MPARTAVASLVGLAAGIALTLIALEGVPPHSVGAVVLQATIMLFPLGAMTFMALVTLRRWIAYHEARTRQEVANLAEQLRLLDEREALLSTDGVLRALKQERERSDRLQSELDELYDLYNQMVLTVMRERADSFGSPALSSVQTSGTEPSSPSDSPILAHEHVLEPRRRKGHLALYLGGGVAAAVASLGTRARSAWRNHRSTTVAVTAAASVIAAGTVGAAVYLATTGDASTPTGNKPSATAPEQHTAHEDEARQADSSPAPRPRKTGRARPPRTAPHAPQSARVTTPPDEPEPPENSGLPSASASPQPSTLPTDPPGPPPASQSPSQCVGVADVITVCLDRGGVTADP